MQNKHFSLLPGFALLLASSGWALPAFAQLRPARTVYAPDPSVPLTLRNIAVGPPVLRLDFSDLRFEDKNGTCVLRDPSLLWSKDNQDGTVVWSGKLGPEPKKFILTTTQTEEDLKDEAGKVLWSQSFLPSLTLDFDRPGHVRLLDATGKEIGSTPIDNSAPPNYPFCGSSAAYHGILFITDTRKRITTVYSGKHLVWSGPRPANEGVKIGRSPDSPVQGAPYAPYPAGETITFYVSKQIGSMSVSDKDHHLLETIPAEIFHMEARCDDPKFVNSSQAGMLFYPHTAAPPVGVTAPGLVSVQYRFADGRSAGGQTIHTRLATREYRAGGISFQHSETGLEVWVKNVDEIGNQTGTFCAGFQQSTSSPLPQPWKHR